MSVCNCGKGEDCCKAKGVQILETPCGEEATERAELIQKLKRWLGEDGLSFFSDVKKKHGKIDAVWSEGAIPHSVHFNEGMQVRNWLRTQRYCKNWDCHDYDNNWVELVEEAMA
jgi:hypothetical protein